MWAEESTAPPTHAPVCFFFGNMQRQNIGLCQTPHGPFATLIQAQLGLSGYNCSLFPMSDYAVYQLQWGWRLLPTARIPDTLTGYVAFLSGLVV